MKRILNTINRNENAAQLLEAKIEIRLRWIAQPYDVIDFSYSKWCSKNEVSVVLFISLSLFIFI